MGRIGPAIIHHADVVGAAIGFNEVVAGHVHIVVVNVDCDGQLCWVRRAISRDADGVVKIGDGVVRYHVTLPVNLHAIIAAHSVHAVDAGVAPAN